MPGPGMKMKEITKQRITEAKRIRREWLEETAQLREAIDDCDEQLAVLLVQRIVRARKVKARKVKAA